MFVYSCDLDEDLITFSENSNKTKQKTGNFKGFTYFFPCHYNVLFGPRNKSIPKWVQFTVTQEKTNNSKFSKWEIETIKWWLNHHQNKWIFWQSSRGRINIQKGLRWATFSIFAIQIFNVLISALIYPIKSNQKKITFSFLFCILSPDKVIPPTACKCLNWSF